MSEITASMVKDLREKTSAGIMDCKKALTEMAGDFEAAVDWLRKKGLAAAAKKSARVAAEGLIAVSSKGTQAAVVEVNAETDFVGRNDLFQSTAREIADAALGAQGDLEKLKAATLPSGATVEASLVDLVAKIGENMGLRRTASLSVSQGVVATYIHSAVAPQLGRIGVLVGLESAAPEADLHELGKRLAMHVAASAPVSLSVQDIDPALVEREKAILVEQAQSSGRPAEIIEKMVEGRLRKFYEEVVFLEQTFVMNNDKRVSQIVEDEEKRLGTPIKVTGFVRFGLGEGIEKEVSNFAEEVAAQIAGTV